MSASNGSGSLTTSVFERIAALDGTNYRSWAFSLKMLLKAHELWEVIEDEELDGLDEAGKAKKMDSPKWRKKDQLALSNIALALKSSEQEHIYSCSTAKAAWDCLKELYEGKGTHRFLSLLKSIAGAKLGEATMKDYIRGVRQTAEQLAEMGVKLEKAAVVGFILNGLPEGYRYLVVNLESQVQTISYEDLSARLMDEEKRMMGRDKIEFTDADTVTAHLAREGRIFPGKDKGQGGKERVCYECKQPGHVARNCPEIMCRCCGQLGHIENTCPVKRFQAKSQQQDNIAYSAIFGG